jgi:membrane-bound serine protease (ClpP class)
MELILILIIAFVAFEVLEHLIFPLIWALRQRRKKPLTGPLALEGQTAEVLEWGQREGYVLVNGERWKAVGAWSLPRGRKVVIHKVEGLILTVKTLDPPEGDPVRK